MNFFKRGLFFFLQIMAVLFVLLLGLLVGLFCLLGFEQHERTAAAALRCIHDNSSQAISTTLEEVHIKVPLSYLQECVSGAPVTADSLDDPTPAIILIARLPDFTPLSEEEKKDVKTRDKIQIEITGTPFTRQEKWKQEGFLFPSDVFLLRGVSKAQGYPRISNQFGMKEYILSEDKVSYVLEDKDSQTQSILACFRKDNRCHAISPYLLSGLTVNYRYDYSQRVNATSIQTNLKQFVETMKVEAGR